MNFEPVRLAFKHLCLWLVLVGVVLLLTLLFNFLGALSCAALTGMMLGAIKHRRWLTLPISLVFPGVVFALMYLSKVELEGQKRIVVPVLCFGAFWMTYLVMCVMAGSEAKEANSRTHPPTVPRTAAASPDRVEAVPVADPANSIGELRLDQLQGRWSCESTDPDGRIKKKVIEITDGRLALRVFDSDGQQRLHIEGGVRFEDSGTSKVLVLSALHNKSSDGAGCKEVPNGA